MSDKVMSAFRIGLWWAVLGLLVVVVSSWFSDEFVGYVFGDSGVTFHKALGLVLALVHGRYVSRELWRELTLWLD
jgi:hypothetical protein